MHSNGLKLNDALRIFQSLYNLWVQKCKNQLFEEIKRFEHFIIELNGIVQFSTLIKQSERQAIELFFNPYKPSVLFVGHMQTTQTQIRHHRGWRLIRVSTVCLENVLLKLNKNEN